MSSVKSSYCLTTLTLLPSLSSRIVTPSSFASSSGSTPSTSANLVTVTFCAFLVPSSNPTIVLRGTPLAFESSSTVRERSLLILSRFPSFLNTFITPSRPAGQSVVPAIMWIPTAILLTVEASPALFRLHDKANPRGGEDQG